MGEPLWPSESQPRPSSLIQASSLSGTGEASVWLDAVVSGDPTAMKLPSNVVMPSMATPFWVVGAVALVHLLPSLEVQDVAMPSAALLVSLPTTMIRPPWPAMPRASKPSRTTAD